MRLKTLLAVVVAGAFAVPFAAQVSAAGDNMILAQGGGPAGSSSVGTGPTGGTPSPGTAGEPKAAAGDNSKRCAGMTGMERDNCMRDDRAAREAAAGTSSSGTVNSSSGGATTGATAGPDSASNKTAPSSDTSTSPSTSGQGKPQ
jgi:hypothetical protein